MVSGSDIITNTLTALKAAGSSMLTAAKTIDLYDGEAQDIASLVPQMTGTPPLCLACYGGSTFSGFTGSQIENFTLLLVYVVKDVNNKGKRLKAIDAMKSAAIEQLMGDNLGLDINPLVPGPVRMQLVTREFSVYSHQFSTFFSVAS
jgi:hypothetical protein